MFSRIMVAWTIAMAIAGVVAAQEDKPPIKSKSKLGKTVIADKSKPIRRALEQQYERIRQATLNKDLQGILELRTPDFTVYMPNGQVWDFETSKNYTQAGFNQVQKNIDLRFIIHEIDVEKDSAAAQIEQHWSRMQMKGGQLRKVETSATQRETWVRTEKGWRLKLIDHIQPGAWYVDGKRIDPSKPYDPNAPPFNPAPPSS